MSEKKKKYDLPADQFFKQVMLSKQAGKITDELAMMFKTFSEKAAHHRNWVRYVHLRDDIVSTCLLKCCTVYEKFRPYRDPELKEKEWEGEDYHHTIHNNPHALLTTACFNELKALIGSEYNQTNIINKKKCSMGLDASYGYEDVYRSEQNKEKEKVAENATQEPQEEETSEFKKIEGLEFE